MNFLIWQGHSYSDVMNYTLRQLDFFFADSQERLKAMAEAASH